MKTARPLASSLPLPSAAIAAAPCSALTSINATRAPREWSRRAVARPMPPAAPVTIARIEVREDITLISRGGDNIRAPAPAPPLGDEKDQYADHVRGNNDGADLGRKRQLASHLNDRKHRQRNVKHRHQKARDGSNSQPQ